MKAIILGAGFGFSSVSLGGSHPAAIHEVSSGRRTLDYQIEAFHDIGIQEIIFVGGYRIEQIIKLYPGLSYYYNPDWQNSGPVISLSIGMPIRDDDIIVCYADVLFSKATLKNLLSSPADIAVLEDPQWITRYGGRGKPLIDNAEKISHSGSSIRAIGRREKQGIQFTGQYAGLVKLSARGSAILRSVLEDSLTKYQNSPFHESENICQAGITDLLQEAIDRGIPLESVVIDDHWAELDAPQDVAQFIFGTKAETLDRLQPFLKKSRILDQVKFALSEWKNDPDCCINLIKEKFGQTSLAIRSSSLLEDGWCTSNAGKYESILGVDGTNREQLRENIQKVFDSYQDTNGMHQCLVQPLLTDVAMAGVVFTRDPETAAPYYIINYDCSGSTTGITSGTGTSHKTLVIYKYSQSRCGNSLLDAVLDSVREVETIASYDSLDIEFALNKNNEVFILQVRPLVANRKLHYFSDRDIAEELRSVQEYIKTLTGPSQNLLGEFSLLGVMPDWNPAEIIGRTPRPLALSLYQYLITDTIWGIQRAEYGYRDTFPSPLIIGIGGQGYVDIRASFNSFVPADIPDDLAKRLVESYLNRLKTKPELHDKVEFDIAFTCFSFDFDNLVKGRLTTNFSEREIRTIRQSLLRLTQEKLENADVFFNKQYGLLDKLRQKRSLKADPTGFPELTIRIRELLENARIFGTLPFAHLARSAFVATELLRSLVRLGIISRGDYQDYLSGIETIAGEFKNDLDLFQRKKIPRVQFLKKYGHLRPNTYDILSPRYDEAPQLFFESRRTVSGAEPIKNPGPFVFSPIQLDKITALLRQNGIRIKASDLVIFIRRSIQGREYAKYEFTRELSEALRLIGVAGNSLGLSREDISYLSIQDIISLALQSSSCNIREEIFARIEANRARYNITKALKLPYLIREPENIECFFLEESQPNFISQKVVRGAVISLNEHYRGESLDNQIVHIQNADPGYDWIFGRNILGLLTTFGGANSHMAIRAAEFGLPAAIGCGELIAQKCKTGTIIELNCETGQINVIK